MKRIPEAVEQADVLVIGGGIVGAFVLRELCRYRLRALLVEAASDLATLTTAANGGVVHAGYDPEPGTRKARLNVRGSALYPAVAAELGVRFVRCGSMIVALDRGVLPALEKYYERGRRNGILAMALITDRDRLFQMEPRLNRSALAAMWCPNTAVINPMQATLATAEHALQNGSRVRLNTPVLALAPAGREALLARVPRGVIRASFVVNADGLAADEVAAMLGGPEFHIRPRKGEQYYCDRKYGYLVRSFLYSPPTRLSKGMSIGPTEAGGITLGVTSEPVDDRRDFSTTRAGDERIDQACRRLIPELPDKTVIRRFAGLRPAIEGEDFLIATSAHHHRLIHAAGIQSPGIAAAPAIAEEVVGLLAEEGLPLRPNPDYVPLLPARPGFAGLTDEERSALIEREPAYGRIVCRCEQVSEGEVRRALAGPLAVPTVDAVKRRTRAGMGRCQGAFCRPRVARLIAEVFRLPIERVTLKGGGSWLFAAGDGEPRDGGPREGSPGEGGR